MHFGIAHVRGRIARDPDGARDLVAAAEARAAKLTSLSGLSPLLTEALTGMAARSAQPAEIGEAAAEVRTLHVTMDENRRRRLRAVRRRPGPFFASSQVGASRFGRFARRVQRNRARPGR